MNHKAIDGQYDTCPLVFASFITPGNSRKTSYRLIRRSPTTIATSLASYMRHLSEAFIIQALTDALQEASYQWLKATIFLVCTKNQFDQLHNRRLSKVSPRKYVCEITSIWFSKYENIHHADSNARPSAYCHTLLHSKLIRVRFLSRPVHTNKSSGWIDPLATRCRYNYKKTYEPFSTQGKVIMLGLEPTHIMLRSERSTHQAALTQLVMYVPNRKITSSRKGM